MPGSPQVIVLTYPLPARVQCPRCWRSEDPEVRSRGDFCDPFHLAKHLKAKHPGDTITYACGECGFRGYGVYPVRPVRAHYEKEHATPRGRAGRSTDGASGSKSNSSGGSTGARAKSAAGAASTSSASTGALSQPKERTKTSLERGLLRGADLERRSRLRSAVAAFYSGTLLAKADQGKVFEVSSRAGVSNHFVRGGSFTRFADWRFIHRAKLDVLPLNGARRWGEADRRCRRCGLAAETLPHVLNHCGVHSAAIQLGHDAALHRLWKACRMPGDKRVNQRVEGIDGEPGELQPDLVVRHCGVHPQREE